MANWDYFYNCYDFEEIIEFYNALLIPGTDFQATPFELPILACAQEMGQSIFRECQDPRCIYSSPPPPLPQSSWIGMRSVKCSNLDHFKMYSQR